MRVLLDTSVLIELERETEATALRLRDFRPRDVAMSAITLAELEVGVLLGKYRKRNRAALDALTKRFKVIAFNDLAAREAAKLIAKQDLKGNRAGMFDSLIAAHANALGVPVAYCDGDFDRFAVRKLAWLVR